MSTVGIIANPASGKDLRRIISSGLTVTNAVKENAVQRMLLAMDALGVERALIMPDRSNLARRVLLDVEGDLSQLQVSQLEMPFVLGTQDDSIRATALMVEQGVDVLIVLGGDGASGVGTASHSGTLSHPGSCRQHRHVGHRRPGPATGPFQWQGLPSPAG